MLVVSEERNGKIIPVLYGDNGIEIMEIPKVRISGKDYMDIPQKYLRRIDQNSSIDTVDQVLENITDRVLNRIQKGFLSSIMSAASFNELTSNRNRDEEKRLRELFNEAHRNTRKR